MPAKRSRINVTALPGATILRIKSLIQSWRLAARARNTRSVLSDALWPVLIVVAGIALAGIIGFVWSQKPSTRIAVAGMFLEWFGIGTVALGLFAVRRHFNRPGWFKRLWNALQRPQDIKIRVPAGSASATGQLATTAISAQGASEEERRLNAIEHAIKQLQHDLNEKTQALAARDDSLSKDIQAEVRDRESAIREVLRQLEDVSAGGIRLEAIGLWWLFFGVLFTSLPDQLAAWLTELM